jgi:hypothetical protein
MYCDDVLEPNVSVSCALTATTSADYVILDLITYIIIIIIIIIIKINKIKLPYQAVEVYRVVRS